MKKRWAAPPIRIFVFLLLGAIVNVAVAWGAALRLQSTTSFYGAIEAPGNQDAIVHVVSGGPMSLVVQTGRAPHGVIWGELGGDFPSKAALPNWAAVRLPPDPAGSGNLWRWQMAWGWPMVSLQSRFDYSFDEHSKWVESSTGTIAVPPVLGIDSSNAQPLTPTKRWLPLRPIWPGFAINTVFYAIILWMLFAAPFALRRWRRIKRGLCPACGYDLRGNDGSACPECGAVRLSV